ncbi:MAG: addiction module protein [Verrucomicrobia bacterium]|nr:addiction module protein [Verrucomicrobiota bacterium]
MAQTYEEVAKPALALPAESRAKLAEELLESLDAPAQARIDALWAAVAERRSKEIEVGEVKPIPGDQVLRELRSRAKP